MSCHWTQVLLDERVWMMLRKFSPLKTKSRASHDFTQQLKPQQPKSYGDGQAAKQQVWIHWEL